MSSVARMKLVVAIGLTLLTWACGGSSLPPSAQSTPSGIRPSAKAQLYVLSNSSPQVSVIDAQTRKIIKTADIPNFTAWSWNDDNNYFDGKDLWLGMINPQTADAEVITLNLDSLQVTNRISVDKEKYFLYIGRPTKDSRLLVAKHGSWQVAEIDIKSHQVLRYVDEPVNAGATGAPPKFAVCDIDTQIGPDGIERAFYPSASGNTVVSLNIKTLQPAKTVDTPPGSNPVMLTVAPDGKVWVQESGSNTNAVFDPVTLSLVKRVATGKGPVDATFSPDGRYGYILHSGDAVISVIDSKTLAEVKRIEVGTNPQGAVAHPNGKYVFAILTKEASVAVIETASWSVTGRIQLGTNPTGIFLKAVS